MIENEMPGSLEGVNILDLSRWGPGAFCTMLLGDMGADVLKVEGPYTNPPPIAAVAEPGISPMGKEGIRDAAYSSINRNKKSIVINLKSDEGHQIFRKLVEKADVVLEDFRPGVSSRLGIDYQVLSKIRPEIVYCSLSSYGQDGPYRDLPGHDINYISLGGALSMIGETGRKPIPPLNLLGNYAAGSLYAIIGILTALMTRMRTGRGQYVDTSMLDGVISLLTVFTKDLFSKGITLKKGESVSSGACPSYAVYRTSDGKYFSVGCIEPWAWQNLCHALGRDDLIPYQYATGKEGEETLHSLEEIFATKSRDEWFQLLRDKEANATPVHDLDEVFTDPHVLHRKMVVELNHPQLGKVKQIGIPFKLSDTSGRIRYGAPLRGQHTTEVLRGLGYTDEDIGKLNEGGTVYSSID